MRRNLFLKVSFNTFGLILAGKMQETFAENRKIFLWRNAENRKIVQQYLSRVICKESHPLGARNALGMAFSLSSVKKLIQTTNYFLRPFPNSSECEPKRTSSKTSFSLSYHINRQSLSIWHSIKLFQFPRKR